MGEAAELDLRYAFRPIFILDLALSSGVIGDYLHVRRDSFASDDSGVIYDFCHKHSNVPIVGDSSAYSIPLIEKPDSESGIEEEVQRLFQEQGFQRVLMMGEKESVKEFDLYDAHLSLEGNIQGVEKGEYLIGELTFLRGDLAWRRLLLNSGAL